MQPTLIAATLALVTSMAAQAATPHYPDVSVPVPEGKGKGKIVIYTMTLGDSKNSCPEPTVDETKLPKMRYGTFVQQIVEPGKHHVSTPAPFRGLFNMIADTDKPVTDLDIEVPANTTVYLRYTLSKARKTTETTEVGTIKKWVVGFLQVDEAEAMNYLPKNEEANGSCLW